MHFDLFEPHFQVKLGQLCIIMDNLSQKESSFETAQKSLFFFLPLQKSFCCPLNLIRILKKKVKFLPAQLSFIHFFEKLKKREVFHLPHFFYRTVPTAFLRKVFWSAD